MISVLEASEEWVLVRTFLSVQEQDLLWKLRADGLPMRAVARRIGRSGGTVNAFLLRFGGVRPSNLGLTTMLLKVAAGLQYAHHRGHVHRDVTPGSILRIDHGAAGAPLGCR